MIVVNTKTGVQNARFYMFTYPLKQHNHKRKCSLQKFKVLHVYIPSMTTQK